MIYFFSLSSSIFSRPTFLQDKAPRNRCSRKRDSRVRDSAYGDRESGNGLVYLEGGGGRNNERRERERGWPRFLGRRGQSEKTEMACSFRIICEPRRGLMSVFHDYRGNREACRRKAGRERERDGSAGGGGDEEEKEASYILYDSVIAFPRTNIALAERAQENVGVNRSSPFYSPRPSVRSFFHPLLPLSLPLFVLPFSSSSSCVPPRTFLLLVYSYRVIESVRNFLDREN